MHYFPPGESMARRVHGERSVGLLYGQRALLIGALEPLTYTGTMLSTKARDRPFERLVRTAKAQEMVFLGTKAEADRLLARVHRRGVRPLMPRNARRGRNDSFFDVVADSERRRGGTPMRSLTAS
jgi:uncharacterized protein (DUF2236 family)